MTTAIRTFRLRIGFCARCAAPLFFNTWRECRRCGVRLCRAHCLNKGRRHSCRPLQTVETS